MDVRSRSIDVRVRFILIPRVPFVGKVVPKELVSVSCENIGFSCFISFRFCVQSVMACEEQEKACVNCDDCPGFSMHYWR